jgi:hypothetical protein
LVQVDFTPSLRATCGAISLFMRRNFLTCFLSVAIFVWLANGFSLAAAPLTATVSPPAPAETGYFKLGTTKNPAGHEISVNSRSLLFDGQPVFPVMGEYHYTRCPQAEWRAELKLQSVGIVNQVEFGKQICSHPRSHEE